MFELTPLRQRQNIPSVFRDMEEMFNRALNTLPFAGVNEEYAGEWSPRLDIAETSEAVIVKAELPGLERENLDIALEKDRLIIKGEKKHETEEKGAGYYLCERAFGSFCRTVQLPVAIEREKIEATFRNGVVTIMLPKAAEARAEITHVKVH